MVQRSMRRGFSVLGLFWGMMLLAVLGCVFSFDAVAQTSPQGNVSPNLRLVRTIGSADGTVLLVSGFTPQNETIVFSRSRSDKNLFVVTKGDMERKLSMCRDQTPVNWAIDSSAAQLASNCDDFSVEIWDVETGQLIRKLSTGRKKVDFAFASFLSSKVNRIAVQFDNVAELWNTENGRKIATLEPPFCNNCNQLIYRVEFSSDGKNIAISNGGSVSLWNSETGELINRLVDDNVGFYGRKILADNGVILSFAFSADGATVFTGSAVGSVKAWDVKSGRLLQTYQKHKQRVGQLAVSPDGRILASGSRNQDVKLSDVETGKQLFTLDNRKEVRRLSFKPDGTRLMSMTSTHYFIWDVSTGQKLDEVPISDFTTRFSEDWKYVLMPDKKNKTVGLYEYIGR